LLYLPPVLFWMLVAEVAVRCLPLARTSVLMGVPLEATPGPAGPAHPTPPLTRWEAGQLGTLRPVARRWPFADGPCLRQSLVAGHVLRRLHPVLRVGVATDGGGLLAHAWVDVGGILLGESSDYAPLISHNQQPEQIVGDGGRRM
jgi:Transglutaminase-like superfamily